MEEIQINMNAKYGAATALMMHGAEACPSSVLSASLIRPQRKVLQHFLAVKKLLSLQQPQVLMASTYLNTAKAPCCKEIDGGMAAHSAKGLHVGSSTSPSRCADCSIETKGLQVGQCSV